MQLPMAAILRLVSAGFSAVLLASCSGAAGTAGSEGEDGEHWVGSWYAAMIDKHESTGDSTYRLIVHNAIGGETVRLRFSNRYGVEPLRLSNVNIALPASPLKLAPVDPQTIRPVLFGGGSEIIIPVGGEVRSDPVAFDLPDDSDVAVTYYVPDPVPNITKKDNALTTSWWNGPGGGDATADPLGLSLALPEVGVPFLNSLEVIAPAQTTTVVVLGDSITDGAFEIPNGDTRWPDLLNDRIAASDLSGLRSVVNAGISGNMVTADRDGNAEQGQAAITRMAWDVFDLPNVSHLIVYEGINDISVGVTAAEIIDGLSTIIAAARRRGITVIASTLTPCLGAVLASECGQSEEQRLAVNDWVLHGGVPDAVVDFNAAVRTSPSPEVWQPQLTVDFLHPNPLGLMVMADAFPLETLR